MKQARQYLIDYKIDSLNLNIYNKNGYNSNGIFIINIKKNIKKNRNQRNLIN